MPETIQFFKLSEKKPDNNQYIFFVDENSSYCGYTIRSGEIVYHQHGQETIYYCDATPLHDDIVWCSAKEMDKMLERINLNGRGLHGH